MDQALIPISTILKFPGQVIFQGKVLVRPIAFRPSPGRPGSSTGPQVPARPGSSTGPSPGPFISRPNSQGFAPGHPLVKDGPRPFGSKLII